MTGRRNMRHVIRGQPSLSPCGKTGNLYHRDTAVNDRRNHHHQLSLIARQARISSSNMHWYVGRLKMHPVNPELCKLQVVAYGALQLVGSCVLDSPLCSAAQPWVLFYDFDTPGDVLL